MLTFQGLETGEETFWREKDIPESYLLTNSLLENGSSCVLVSDLLLFTHMFVFQEVGKPSSTVL